MRLNRGPSDGLWAEQGYFPSISNDTGHQSQFTDVEVTNTAAVLFCYICLLFGST